LNQGAPSGETGAGLSVGLWGDLVTAGYGWNLGLPGNPPYFFIGLGMLELLQKVQNVKNGVSD